MSDGVLLKDVDCKYNDFCVRFFSSWLVSSSWNASQIEHVTFWHSFCRHKTNTVVLNRFSIFVFCFTMDSKLNWIILVLFSPFDKNEGESLVGTFERIVLIRIFLESLSPRPRLSALFTIQGSNNQQLNLHWHTLLGCRTTFQHHFFKCERDL